MATDLVERGVHPEKARDTLLKRFSLPQLVMHKDAQQRGVYAPSAHIPHELHVEEDAIRGMPTKLYYGFAIQCRNPACTTYVHNKFAVAVQIKGTQNPPALYYCRKACKTADEPTIAANIRAWTDAAICAERRMTFEKLGIMVSADSAADFYAARLRKWELAKERLKDTPEVLQQERAHIWAPAGAGSDLVMIAQTVLHTPHATKWATRVEATLHAVAPDIHTAIKAGSTPRSVTTHATRINNEGLEALMNAMQRKMFKLEHEPDRCIARLIPISPALTTVALQHLVASPPENNEEADTRIATFIAPWGTHTNIRHVTAMELAMLSIIMEAIPRLQPKMDIVIRGFDPPGSTPTKHVMCRNKAYTQEVDKLAAAIAGLSTAD